MCPDGIFPGSRRKLGKKLSENGRKRWYQLLDTCWIKRGLDTRWFLLMVSRFLDAPQSITWHIIVVWWSVVVLIHICSTSRCLRCNMASRLLTVTQVFSNPVWLILMVFLHCTLQFVLHSISFCQGLRPSEEEVARNARIHDDDDDADLFTLRHWNIN